MSVLFIEPWAKAEQVTGEDQCCISEQIMERFCSLGLTVTLITVSSVLHLSQASAQSANWHMADSHEAARSAEICYKVQNLASNSADHRTLARWGFPVETE
eukprot:scpid81251/ scgid12089/ 